MISINQISSYLSSNIHLRDNHFRDGIERWLSGHVGLNLTLPPINAGNRHTETHGAIDSLPEPVRTAKRDAGLPQLRTTRAFTGEMSIRNGEIRWGAGPYSTV